MKSNIYLTFLINCLDIIFASVVNKGDVPSRVLKGLVVSSRAPYFDNTQPKNITAFVGQTAILPCRVKQTSNRTVSWIRKRDLHVLTSHIFTYTGDARFSVQHREPSDDWDLKINFVQPLDAGVYECQLNTEPKINSPVVLFVHDGSSTPATFVHSRSSAESAMIWGPKEIFVKKGSTISLTCSVNISSLPPPSIEWYHENTMVDFDSPRGGISLEIQKTAGGGTISKLMVKRATFDDSGNYTCVPSNARSTSVPVHVNSGEHPAAMQTSSEAISYVTSKSTVRMVCLLYGLVIR